MTARSLSWVGDGIGNVALVIYVQRIEGTGRAVGLLLFVAMLPSCLGPLTGVVADRFNRRSVLIGCEYGQALVGAAIVVWLPALPMLLVLLFAKAVAGTVSDVAGRSVIPSLVEDDALVRSNAWFGGARQGADVLGPLLGGIVVATAGVRVALAIDVATFLASVPLLLRLPALAAGNLTSAGWLADARAGMRYIARNRVARGATVGFFLVGLTAADDVALPFLARELGGGDVSVGLLYAAVAAGLVLGYVLLARGRVHLAPVTGFVGGGVVVGVGEVLTGLAPAIALAVTFQLVRGVGTAAIDVNLQTLLQRSVPADMLGRVFANVYGAVGISAAISVVVAGPLLDATSPGTVLVLAGVAAFAASASSALLLRE